MTARLSSRVVTPATLVVALSLALGSCTTTDTSVDTTSPSGEQASLTTSPQSASGTATSDPPTPTHRIGVRTVEGAGEFYDVTTGERFVPRGMNYHMWADTTGGGLFDALLATRFYDPDVIQDDLSEMENLGFNTLRIFLECHPASGCIGTGPSGTKVNPAFMDNVADLLRMAGEHGMVVLVASNTLPDDSWWLNQTARVQNETFEAANNEFLNPDAVPFYVDYWHQIVEGLVARGATENVLGYELRQEHFFDVGDAPLSLTEGMVTAANGVTYDMSVAEDKDRIVDEGLTFWAELIRDDILSLDPTGLVTVGFFTPNSPNAVMPPDDTRLVRTSYFLRNSEIDFLDFHHYPGNGVDDGLIWENFGFEGNDPKPIVLGEFGAIKDWWPNIGAGATAVMGLEVDACRAGFDGFILWGWRSDLLQDMYWATDGNLEMAQVVAPINRPDPCQYGQFDFVRYNVAGEGETSASSSMPGAGPSMVIDGTPALWNAADRAPGWVEITLPNPRTVDAIELWVAQSPGGHSTHEVWIQQEGGDLELVHTFDGDTNEGDILTFQPETPLVSLIRVRIVTTSLGDLAPAWHEIILYSPDHPD